MTVLVLVQDQEIKITKIDNTPGVLPLETEIRNLENEYNKLNSSLILKPEIFLSHNLRNIYEHLQPLISEVLSKFQNLKPLQNQRKKRGLVKVGGSIAKFLFGTLDATDAEHYDKTIQILKSNQEKIVKGVITQISLSKQMTEKFSKTIEAIVNNQKQMIKYINKYRLGLNDVSSELYKYITYQSIFEQIFLNANVIVTFLDNIENAIVFSKLHVIHPDVLTIQNLNYTISELAHFYDRSQILNLNLHNWYFVANSNCYISENKVIFAIEFPIVIPQSIEYFRLIPIPTVNNTLIIPKKPYLALVSGVHQYMVEPCKPIENIFICNQGEVKVDTEDCITSLILNKRAYCQQTPIQPPLLMFRRINEEYIIVISKNQIKMTFCPHQQYFTIKGSFLLQIPQNCSISYQSYQFGNRRQQLHEGSPLVLPKIEDDSSLMMIVKRKPIHMDNISLDELHQLQYHIQTTEELSIAEMSSYNPITIGTITIGIIIIGSIGLVLVWKVKIWKTTASTRDENTHQTSVLYQPEVLA